MKLNWLMQSTVMTLNWGGVRHPYSDQYDCQPTPITRRLFRQMLSCALARYAMGLSIVSRMAMMEITTSSSISVKARRAGCLGRAARHVVIMVHLAIAVS